MASAIKGLRPFFESSEVEPSHNWDGKLRGLRFGREENRFQWRQLVDAKHFYLQKNSGTEASPNWVTKFQVGASGPNFDHAELDSLKVNGIITAEAFYVRSNGAEFADAGLKVPDGSSSAPSVAFTNDPDTGMWTSSSAIRFGVGGAEKLTVAGGAIATLVAIRTTDGSAAQPAHSFTNNIDLGMFRTAEDTLGFATAGTQHMSIDPGGHVRMEDTLNVENAVTGEAFYVQGGSEVFSEVAGLGAGENLFGTRGDKTLNLKSLVEGANITLTSNGNEITLASTGVALDSVTDGTNTYTNVTDLHFSGDRFYLSSDAAGAPAIVTGKQA